MAASLTDELKVRVTAVLCGQWSQRNSTKVPDPESIVLGDNAGVNIEGAVLYADMHGSTALVDQKEATFAAEVYRSYLMCAARIIKSEGGTVTAYDGDRIMAVFVGDSKRTIAARAALKINYAVDKILNPALQEHYPVTSSDFQLKHAVGVDCSDLLVSRIGVKNDNDLVWVGRAANHAAKLTEMNDRHPVFITENVFTKMKDASKFGGSNRTLMWEKRSWTQMGGLTVYSSNWTWTP